MAHGKRAAAGALRTCLVAGGWIAACSSPAPVSEPCNHDKDCLPTEVCVASRCVTGNLTCSGAAQDCPSGMSCCGGLCSATRCCGRDLECPGGFCNGGRCQSGARPACSDAQPCPTGRCLRSEGRCVECLYADDCVDDTLLCSAAHLCVPPATCNSALCAGLDQICDPEGGCRPCIGNSECGGEVCVAGACVPCTSPAQCGIGRTCANGLCETAAGTPCERNEDCGDRICALVGQEKQCVDCGVSPECGAGRSCVGGRCVADNPQCSLDADCLPGPPTQICQGQLCVAGCTPGGCAAGQECSPQTGHCVVFSSGSLPLGATCAAHGDCASNLCWPFNNAGSPALACTESCVRGDDCPAGFMCWEFGDGNACLPLELAFGAPVPRFADPPGTSCGPEFDDYDCRTGYCHTVNAQAAAPVCMEVCSRNADCAALPGLVCVSGWPLGSDANGDGVLSAAEISGFTELCHAPWGTVADGQLCGTTTTGFPLHDRCQSGFCPQTPNFYLEPRCAHACCTPSDCTGASTGGPVCKPLDVWDGVRDDLSAPYGFQKVCLPREYSGLKNVGEPCAAAGECKTEICAGPPGSQRCTHTCCTNADCAAYDWGKQCRPPFAPPAPLSDGNFDAIITSLGRQLFTSAGVGVAKAVSSICMPQ